MPRAQDVVAEGYDLPSALEDWARFDYVTTSSPWVDAATTERVRRAAFYSQLGWSRPRLWAGPVQAMARWRCRHDRFGLPIEKQLIERLTPPPPLA